MDSIFQKDLYFPKWSSLIDTQMQCIHTAVSCVNVKSASDATIMWNILSRMAFLHTKNSAVVSPTWTFTSHLVSSSNHTIGILCSKVSMSWSKKKQKGQLAMAVLLIDLSASLQKLFIHKTKCHWMSQILTCWVGKLLNQSEAKSLIQSGPYQNNLAEKLLKTGLHWNRRGLINFIRRFYFVWCSLPERRWGYNEKRFPLIERGPHSFKKGMF